MFESLVFKGISLGRDIDIEIWADNGKLYYTNILWDLNKVLKNKTSTMSVEELTKRLDGIGILKWSRNYESGELTEDGLTWIVKYMDSRRKRKKIIEGRCDFPDTWDEFEELVSEVMGDISDEDYEEWMEVDPRIESGKKVLIQMTKDLFDEE